MTRLDMINQCFCGESCEEILSSLEHLATQVQEKWVIDAITSMKSANPLGLKIFLRTGARAMLIDKDKKPKWVPSKLEDVTEEMVAKCFSRSFTEDDDWLPLQLPTKTSGTHVGASKL
ncbi:putative 3-hydroxyisobutyryl-CoA hydrolase [Helianthus annuus]|nr:putative 3-hydroxyisobutyryl-CoA hydrolase [Helianthus annuus]